LVEYVIVPVANDVGMIIALSSTSSYTTTTTYRSSRSVVSTEAVPTPVPFQSSGAVPVNLEEIGKEVGDTYTDSSSGYSCRIIFFSDGFDDGHYAECFGPQLILTWYRTRAFFSYSWNVISSVSTSPATEYSTEAYLFSIQGIKKIATPPGLVDAMLNLAEVPSSEKSQGLGISAVDQYQSSIVGTPRTIEALTAQEPQTWSRKWLQFREVTAGSGKRFPFVIKDLDPETKLPLDPDTGFPSFDTYVPVTAPQVVLDSLDSEEPFYSVFVTWDWEQSSQCRQKLIDLGFSSESLIP
jgi:hypothetical protein